MAARGEYSYPEIITQTESWQCAIDATLALSDTLKPLLQNGRQQGVVFCGCGSTHYLAQFAAPYYQRMTGATCRGVPSSELALQTDTLLTSDDKPLVVALSRSGETSETVMAVKKMAQRGCPVLTISCYDQTPLSAASDLTIGIEAGREQSFAQTRSFAGMLVAVQTCAALAPESKQDLSELRQLTMLGADVIARAEMTARTFGPDETIKRITYLGSGERFGLAAEATVKMKEMSLSLAEPYRFMEFRHGPMSLVDSEHLIVALLSDEMEAYERAVLLDLKERGARIVAIAPTSKDLDDVAEAVLPLNAPIAEASRAVLYLPLVQLLAYYRAMGRGLNPDRPRNVVMAIQLDGTEMAG